MASLHDEHPRLLLDERGDGRGLVGARLGRRPGERAEHSLQVGAGEAHRKKRGRQSRGAAADVTAIVAASFRPAIVADHCALRRTSSKPEMRPSIERFGCGGGRVGSSAGA